jgi:hypothetical protein
MIIVWAWIVPLLIGLDYLSREALMPAIKRSVPFRTAVYTATLTAVVSTTFILASVIGWRS